MADLGFVERELNALPPEQRVVLVRIFRSILRDMRFGHSSGTPPDPSVNFGAGFYSATTPAVANTEFTVAHGFGRAPYLAVPVLRLDAVHSQLARVAVTRAADDKRAYFSCPDTSVPITLLIEG